MTPVKLTIDGQPVAVQPGTTLLQAARSLGIEIPTLCHVEGSEPAAACFLCSVQVDGLPTLSPACAAAAEEGMVVTTDSDDIRASRKMAMELLLSDHAGDCIAPCSASCPAGLDVAGFVYEIASGQLDRSMSVIFERLSLPGALGRICPRLCEQSCRRTEHDHQGLAIASLHRYAADRNFEEEKIHLPQPEAASGRKVAIVGAGPAGLTAAFYLQLRGHACTLYDAHPLPGGMLRYGIPEFRLPRPALDAEIRLIEQLGARFIMNSRWGRDFHLADLRHDFDAVFLGIGAQLTGGLTCDGGKLASSGLELLRRVATGESPTLGRRVVVIGGGNTAMDVARTALRLGSEVRVLYRRTRREMPCLMEEVEAAEEEGIAIEFLVAPKHIQRLSDDLGEGRGLRLDCTRMVLGEPDESGRLRPEPVPNSGFAVDCDAVVAATGQAVDIDLAVAEGLRATDHGLWTDAETLATNLPGVFAGGDAVVGADLAVRAVAAGRLAATSIDQYLRGHAVTGPRELTALALRPVDEGERAALFRAIELTDRVTTPALDPRARVADFSEIVAGLRDEQARQESVRCMTCGCRKADGCRLRRYATVYGSDPYRFLGARRRFLQDTSHPEIVYEPGKCIMCDACVRITAEAGERLGLATVGRGFDVAVSVPFDQSLSEGLLEVGRHCAQACPTGALSLKSARSCDLANADGDLIQIEQLA